MPARTNEFQRLVYLLRTHAAQGATVTESKMLVDLVTGAEREVDIAVETTVSGHHLLIAIECRDHRRPADVTWVEQMKAKHERLPSHALVLVSRAGFTKQATAAARTWKVETYSLDAFDAADAGKLVWRNFYELKPTRVRTHVVASDGNTIVVRSHPTTEVFTTAGVSVGSVNDIVSGLLNLPQTRRYMEVQGQTQHRYFEMGWDLPPEPAICLRKLRPNTLQQIKKLHIVGKAKFDPVEFRVRQARLGGTSFLWGSATALGSPAIAVVTERAGGHAVVSTSVIPKSKKARGTKRAARTTRGGSSVKARRKKMRKRRTNR